MTSPTRRIALFMAIGLMITACGSDDATPADVAPQFPDGSVAVIANADIAIGQARLLVAVARSDGGRLGSPADSIALEVAPIDQPEMRQRVDGVFMWIIEDAFGLYRADFAFDTPGVWTMTVVPHAGKPLEPAAFAVATDTIAPGIGDPAPLTPTPTAADAPFDEITTDPDPDPRFYALSLDEAIVSGRRTVAVFSTPAFCRTATCGPLLDRAKEIAAGHPDVNWVHVEIYTNLQDPDFVPDGSYLSPVVTETGWNLPSEPWIFVIDEQGTISHRFEGVLDPAELVAALS